MAEENFPKTKNSRWAIVIAGFFLVALGYLSSMAAQRSSTVDDNFSITGIDGKKSSLRYGPWPSLTNADFFERVKKEFLNGKKDFIEADLSSMVVKVYKNGEVNLEVPILTKGRKGSWWETPAGLYSIKTKEKSHYSSIGKVTMPWSMQFQGNFFIHGWPYYSDGQPVTSSYSGGCVRLSTEDAEKVYALSNAGMPILVFEDDFLSDNFQYRPKAPEISAQAYLAADLKNNFVFIEKNSTEVLPVYSITKLMTGVVSAERINLDKKISITDEALVQTIKPRLSSGKPVTAYDLLFPLLEESSNEAGEALAIQFGRSGFIRSMNENAKSLGMEHTTFVDPTGISDGNASSAEDLFSLAKYLLNNRSFIFDVTAGRETNGAYSQSSFSGLQNLNGFSNHPNFVGGKTGTAEEDENTMISVFNVSLQGGKKRPVVIVVLGARDVVEETRKILQYVQEEYE